MYAHSHRTVQVQRRLQTAHGLRWRSRQLTGKGHEMRGRRCAFNPHTTRPGPGSDDMEGGGFRRDQPQGPLV